MRERRAASPVALSALAIVALASAGAACGRRDRPATADLERLASHVLAAPPADVGHRLDIDYDGKVTLLGCRVEPERPLAPGDLVRFTLYWRVDAPLPPGFSLFTHLLDGAGVRVLNLDQVGPLRQWKDRRQVLGPWAWEPGKTYVDEQELRIPRGLRSRRLELVGGLFRGDERLPIRSGPHDAERRGRFAELTVVPPAIERTVPSLRVPHRGAGSVPRIDGRLDEPVWQAAAATGPFRDVATGAPIPRDAVGGSALLFWDDTALYVGVTLVDTDVQGGFPAGAVDPHLWTQDTAELMFDPDGDGDGRDYFEIQIGPQDLVFDSRFDSYNAPRGGPDGPFGHQDWSSGVQSAVVVLGTLDQPGDRDEGYVVEARLPWSAFVGARRAPPAPGDEWRANFYAIERNRGAAWSPILGEGNFHRASRFGRLRFDAPTQASGAPGGSASGTGAARAVPSSSAASPPAQSR
jgi:hypothetical protein